jgi:hypothetical protein
MTYKAEAGIHDVAIKVDVYPDEFRPIMKALKYALICEDSRKILNEDEWSQVNDFLDDFSSTALNEGI